MKTLEGWKNGGCLIGTAILKQCVDNGLFILGNEQAGMCRSGTGEGKAWVVQVHSRCSQHGWMAVEMQLLCCFTVALPYKAMTWAVALVTVWCGV